MRGGFLKDNYNIVANLAQCRLCTEIIESKHRHDFVRCYCGEIHVDGGTEYLKRGATDFHNIIEMSIYADNSEV